METHGFHERQETKTLGGCPITVADFAARWALPATGCQLASGAYARPMPDELPSHRLGPGSSAVPCMQLAHTFAGRGNVGWLALKQREGGPFRDGQPPVAGAARWRMDATNPVIARHSLGWRRYHVSPHPIIDHEGPGMTSIPHGQSLGRCACGTPGALSQGGSLPPTATRRSL